MSAAVSLPIAGTADAVFLPLDELPAEAAPVLDVLRAEAAPLEVWRDVARAYLAQGRARQFLSIIADATSPEAEAHFGPAGAGERALLHCCAAGYHMKAAAAAGAAAAAPGLDPAAAAARAGMREKALAAAGASLAAARRASPEEPLVAVGLAQLALARGGGGGGGGASAVAEARRELERGLARGSGGGRPSAAPHLALADLLLPTDPAAAAGHYGRALRLVGGNGPASRTAAAATHARLGLGAAHYRAGRPRAAAAAWERALDAASGGAYAAAAAAAAASPSAAADPATWEGVAASAPAAMAGLAAVDLGEPGAAARSRGAARLAAAFTADPARPATLCLLSRQALVSGSPDRAASFARAAVKALGRGGAPDLRCAATTAAARAHHAAGELRQALAAYGSAAAEDAGAPLPLLGLAQLTALKDQGVTNAAATAERALERAPGWGAALRLLAPLYAHGAGGGSAGGAGALPHFRAAAAKPGAAAADHEALGELLARRGDARGAAGAYADALRSARSEADAAGGAPLPARLLNNAACAAFRVGDPATAAALLDEALEHRAGLAGSPGYALTVGYNRARVLEAVAGPATAAAEHAAIAAAFPEYTDCRVRLAALAAGRGDMAAAAAAVDAALAADPGAADAPAVLARALLANRSFTAAAAAFSRVDAAVRAGRAARAAAARAAGQAPDPADAPDAGPDPFAELGRAALLLHSAPPASAKRSEDKARRAAHLRRASDAFCAVLRSHPKCAAAAAGVGAAMAEAGAIDGARDVLLAVHEAVSAAGGALDVPDAAANLGHANLAGGKPGVAAKLYEIAARGSTSAAGAGRTADSADRAAALAPALGRALYDAGDMRRSRAALARGLRARPSHASLRFNIALTLETGASSALSKPRPPTDPTALAGLEAAADEIRLAGRLFKALAASVAALPPGTRPPSGTGPALDPATLAMHVAFCEGWAARADPLVAAARVAAEARAARTEQSKQEHAAAVAQAAVAAELAAQEAAAAKAAREDAAREARDRLDRLRGQWAEAALQKKAAAAGDAAGYADARRARAEDAARDAALGVGGGGGSDGEGGGPVDLDDDDDGGDYDPDAPDSADDEHDDDDDDGDGMDEDGPAPGGARTKRPAEEGERGGPATEAKRPRTAVLESDGEEEGALPAAAAPAVNAADLFGSESE